MKILITSGGTKIPIDKVRSITNMSSGTFGSAICEEFLKHGDHVDFVMAEGSKTPFELRLDGRYPDDLRYETWRAFVNDCREQYKQYTYKTFNDYLRTVTSLLRVGDYDIIILAAAVSDYGVANYVDGKIRFSAALEIQLRPLPKVIASVCEKQPGAYLVGFKLLVNSEDKELIAAAQDSIRQNGCDMVVANDLRDIQQNDHRLLIVTPNDVVIKRKGTEQGSLASALVNIIRQNRDNSLCQP